MHRSNEVLSLVVRSEHDLPLSAFVVMERHKVQKLGEGGGNGMVPFG